MVDDQDKCKWVNVKLSSNSPRQKAVVVVVVVPAAFKRTF